MDHTVLPANYTMLVFCFASVHQTAPPLTEVEGIWLELTTHLSIPKGRKAELAWMADLQWMLYPHKWLTISYRSSEGQGSLLAKDRRYTAAPRNQPVPVYTTSPSLQMTNYPWNAHGHVMWSSLYFKTPNHISGITEARIVQFPTQVD